MRDELEMRRPIPTQLLLGLAFLIVCNIALYLFFSGEGVEKPGRLGEKEFVAMQDFR